MIEREQAEGKARASGREGLSAERQRTDALATYGRSQAELVENLVFAKDERTYALGKGKLTKDYQKTLKGKDKDLIDKDKNLEVLSRDRELGKLDISSSKITNALNETLAQIGFDKDRVQSALRKSTREYKIGSGRISTKRKFLNKRLKLNTRRRELVDERNDLSKREIRTPTIQLGLNLKLIRTRSRWMSLQQTWPHRVESCHVLRNLWIYPNLLQLLKHYCRCHSVHSRLLSLLRVHWVRQVFGMMLVMLLILVFL